MESGPGGAVKTRREADVIHHHDAASRDIVVVGASAGGVEALQVLVSGLPHNLSAAVLVVLHVPRKGPRALAAILDRAGPLAAAQAEHGDVPRDGRVYVAPSDYHLVLRPGEIQLTQDAAVNGFRPSIDALFRSAAEAYGHRVIAIVLSGSGDDGAAGMLATVQRGGIAIIQDPAQAAHRSMPLRAQDQVPGALVREVQEIGPLVAQLVSAAALEEIITPNPVPAPSDDRDDPTESSVDSALWLAVRALQEKAALNERMARSRRALGDEDLAARYEEFAAESEHAMDTIRDLLHSRRRPPAGRSTSE
jgi:two-component system, chemotaxis family, protein-glutamate methylesterase/glutaminase